MQFDRQQRLFVVDVDNARVTASFQVLSKQT